MRISRTGLLKIWFSLYVPYFTYSCPSISKLTITHRFGKYLCSPCLLLWAERVSVTRSRFLLIPSRQRHYPTSTLLRISLTSLRRIRLVLKLSFLISSFDITIYPLRISQVPTFTVLSCHALPTPDGQISCLIWCCLRFLELTRPHHVSIISRSSIT